MIAVGLMFVRGHIQAVADNVTSRVVVGLSLSEMGLRFCEGECWGSFVL